MTATAIVSIPNTLGLHARPAMLFVDLAGGFTADITVRRVDHSETVDGKSIMQLMVLAATQHTEIEISANGDDAESAIRELVALVESGFHEE